MLNRDNRIFGYDLIKTVAIFMIVFYHLGGLDYGAIDADYFFPNINKIISSFCAASVPLFLMVNGALIIRGFLNCKQLLSRSAHLLFISLFWKLLLEYVISSQLLSIKEEMVHFWFLATLAGVYLVSTVFNRSKTIRTIVLLGLFLFPFTYNFLVDLLIVVKPHLVDALPIKHTGFFTLYAILYFYLGYFFSVKMVNKFYSWALVLLGVLLVNFEVIVISNHYHIIFDGVNSSFPTIGALVLSIGIFMLLKDKTSNNRMFDRFVTWIGHNTMSIYLFHVLFIFILRYYVLDIAENIFIAESLIIVLGIIIISSLLGDLIVKCRLSFLLKYSHRYPFFSKKNLIFNNGTNKRLDHNH